ncbi:MAG TPA: hypothetical protein VM865_06635 [Acidobacteriaceae bacterium]|nr:hypothetical protein [Acidobacteriaceae bacterium]
MAELSPASPARNRTARMKDKQRNKQIDKRRNLPVYIIFWIAVLALLFIFWKAFSGPAAP